MPTQTELLENMGTKYESTFWYFYCFSKWVHYHQDGRVVKALDLSSNGRVVRVGSNPTPGKKFFFSPVNV